MSEMGFYEYKTLKNSCRILRQVYEVLSEENKANVIKWEALCAKFEREHKMENPEPLIRRIKI
jgi:hypothetical protein